MSVLARIAKSLLRPWLVILLMPLVGATLGYHANANFRWLSEREVLAAPAPTLVRTPGPTATPAPTVSPPAAPTASPGEGQPSPAVTVPASGAPDANEMDAAASIIPLPKGALPRGARKPPPVRLVIPSIDIDAKVIELATRYNDKGQLIWETAAFAAGHHVGTANPGEQGNVVISGHISSTKEGAVFKRLPEIGVGDGVVVVTGDRDYLYRVIGKKVVEPSQVEVMSASFGEVLTLITCVPDGEYSHRLVVTARRV